MAMVLILIRLVMFVVAICIDFAGAYRPRSPFVSAPNKKYLAQNLKGLILIGKGLNITEDLNQIILFPRKKGLTLPRLPPSVSTLK